LSSRTQEKKEFSMTIGLIGAGNIGRAVAIQALHSGHRVVVSNSRGPDSLAEVVKELGDGARAGSVAEASTQDIVVLSVPWTKVGDATAGLDLAGRIVIDATNPIEPPDFHVADLGGLTSGQVVAEKLVGARLVKAANTLPAAVLAADPHQGDGRRVIVLSGDDADAKGTVAEFFEGAGFATIDLGGLADGGRLQEVGAGGFSGRNLVQLP
jgi:predicted dinucleotide-binding enzyme